MSSGAVYWPDSQAHSQSHLTISYTNAHTQCSVSAAKLTAMQKDARAEAIIISKNDFFSLLYITDAQKNHLPGLSL